MIYRTDFRLTEDVLNEDEARAYLLSDNMTRYLISDVKDPLLRDNIIGIKWILLTPRIGYVELTTEGLLSEENLEFISKWIKGQCSDGLGEGFRDQDFAAYNVNPYDEDSEIIQVDFDWRTNDFKFYRVM